MATVYVDHYSHLSYVHLQIINTGSEVQKSKIAFEKHVNSYFESNDNEVFELDVNKIS